MTILSDLRLSLAFFRLLRKWRSTGKGGTLAVRIEDADEGVSRDA